MRTSAFLFAHDVLGETVEVVLDRLQQAGLSGAVMADDDLLARRHRPVRCCSAV